MKHCSYPWRCRPIPGTPIPSNDLRCALGLVSVNSTCIALTPLRKRNLKFRLCPWVDQIFIRLPSHSFRSTISHRSTMGVQMALLHLGLLDPILSQWFNDLHPTGFADADGDGSNRLSLLLAAGPRRFQWPSAARILLCWLNTMDGFISHCKGFASTFTAGAMATSTAGATGSDAVATVRRSSSFLFELVKHLQKTKASMIDLRFKSGCWPLHKFSKSRQWHW